MDPTDGVQQLRRTQHSYLWIISFTGLDEIKMEPLLFQEQSRRWVKTSPNKQKNPLTTHQQCLVGFFCFSWIWNCNWGEELGRLWVHSVRWGKQVWAWLKCHLHPLVGNSSGSRPTGIYHYLGDSHDSLLPSMSGGSQVRKNVFLSFSEMGSASPVVICKMEAGNICTEFN